MEPTPTALYRLYAITGALLYVGVSDQPDERFKQHAAVQAWWSEVADKKTAWLGDRDAALIAEAQAIHDEDPIYNDSRPDPVRLREHMEATVEARREEAAELAAKVRCPCCRDRLPALKVCANEACRKTYYFSEAGRVDAVFCSVTCADSHPRPGTRTTRRKRRQETTKETR